MTLPDTTTEFEFPSDYSEGDNEEMLRDVTIDRWRVVTFTENIYDRHGKEGLRVLIAEDGAWVYDTGSAPGGLVYCSPMHAIDSDEAVISCINLCCYDAMHDDDDHGVDPDWDAEGLSEQAALYEED